MAKLNAAGTVASTWVGAHSTEGRGIAVDATGSAYVTGRTTSANFPTAGVGPAKLGAGGLGAFGDAFVTKLNPGGTALTYSHYLGGTNDDEGTAIAVDSGGSTYVTGFTFSADFPTAGGGPTKFGGGPLGASRDAFVAQLVTATPTPTSTATRTAIPHPYPHRHAHALAHRHAHRDGHTHAHHYGHTHAHRDGHTHTDQHVDGHADRDGHHRRDGDAHLHPH